MNERPGVSQGVRNWMWFAVFSLLFAFGIVMLMSGCAPQTICRKLEIRGGSPVCDMGPL